MMGFLLRLVEKNKVLKKVNKAGVCGVEAKNLIFLFQTLIERQIPRINTLLPY